MEHFHLKIKDKNLSQAPSARRELSLDGLWSLRYCDAGQGEEEGWPGKGVSGEGAYIAFVPGDVHLDLMRANAIKEPLFGENAKTCEWMEEKDWWYSVVFVVDEDFIQDRVELCFEGLDTRADIWLNGHHLGSSINALVPWIADMTNVIHPGENLLVVRLDCGIRWAMTQDLSHYYGAEKLNVREYSRIFLRRAQFSVTWDWAPRLMTTGIWRPVTLRSYRKLALRDVFLATHLTENGAEIKAQIEVECFSDEEQEAVFHLRLSGSGEPLAKNLESTLAPGYNLITTTLFVKEPHLWWPNGLGEPFLYDLTCNVTVDGQVIDSTGFKYGIREIDLLQEPISEGEGQSFTIVVNGKKVFCKGADWAPGDSIMARMTPEKYEALVQEAVEANFNMFRIWGGGIYEDEAFYNSCDQKGIMIWQDFMFACSQIPEDREDFMAEVAREAELVIKRLRNHPCIVLWCGNNENQWMFRALQNRKKFYGWRVYHGLLPTLCAHLDPTRPYWPSSPYGGLDVNSERLGDRHAWDIYLGRKDESRVRYKDFKTDRGKFISEFGFLAPPVMDTLKRCLPTDEIWHGSPSWNFHNNTFERDAVGYALKEHFGKETKDLPLEEYLTLSQIFQAEAYRYVLSHFRRRQYYTSGALFWMFSDCWGATSGWTIVDYYLNRKPSFYAVKHAFAPIMVSFKEEDDGLSIWVVNGTLSGVFGLMEYGCGTFDSESLRVLGREEVTVTANTSKELVEISFPEFSEEERRNHYYWVKLNKEDQIVSKDRYFLAPWKDMKLPSVSLEQSLQHLGADKYLLRVKADRFAWMVEVKADERLMISDNYFDLLPGETHELLLRGPRKAIEGLSVKAVNNLLIKSGKK